MFLEPKNVSLVYVGFWSRIHIFRTVLLHRWSDFVFQFEYVPNKLICLDVSDVFPILSYLCTCGTWLCILKSLEKISALTGNIRQHGNVMLFSFLTAHMVLFRWSISHIFCTRSEHYVTLTGTVLEESNREKKRKKKKWKKWNRFIWQIKSQTITQAVLFDVGKWIIKYNSIQKCICNINTH